MTCEQINGSGERCSNEAAYKYTWPGRDEMVICEEHVGKLRGIAGAMGLHLQIRPLTTEDVQKGM